MADGQPPERLPRPARKRLLALRWGALAEYLAVAWLLLTGYRILAFRYRTKLGEIDVIAAKGRLIACVEVKARRDVATAIDAVSPLAQARIRAASDLWLARQPGAASLSLRYDILAITPWALPRHIRDAF